ALATLACLRSYLAERVDEQGDEAGAQQIPPNEFILQSVAFALYSTIEMLNRPLGRPKSIVPNDIIHALERKIQGTISRDQQDAHELFQIISSVLTSEEEEQYKNQTPSLLDIGTLRHLTTDSDPFSSSSDNFETSSMSSIGTLGSMWSSFSVSTTGGNLHRRPRRPRNPFTGLAASKISCMKCGYTAPIRHHTFDNISLTVPQTLSCTLESCLSTYTKMDILTDYQCRKCTLLHTLELLTKSLESMDDSNGQRSILENQIHRLNEALKNNIETDLPDISLTPPQTTSCTSKQTMFANPPKSLCLHLSRSVYHPSGYVQKNHCNVQFPEYLDLAPYSTNGFLNTQDPSASLSALPNPTTSTSSQPQMRTSRTSLVYLRNMAGKRLNHGNNDQEDGLNILLPNQSSSSPQSQQRNLNTSVNNNNNGNNHHKLEDRNVPSLLPSLTIPTVRPIQYRLTAVIVHHGGHESGHFITYRRKKLPTGQDVRSPLSNDYFYGNYGIYHHHHLSSPNHHHHSMKSKFWRCNDELVEEVDLDTVLSSEAYMLFYERDI
ncbi:hypothetical protein BJ944DRAFT_244529, partial [Cunninghamella echinulata]